MPDNATFELLPSPYDWCDTRPGYDFIKRVIDVIVACCILLILSPLWIAVAVAIRFTSSGPALYARTVIGRKGSPFTYYKFRTMHAGDDSHHRDWLRQFVNADAPYAGDRFKVQNDPRVTPVGLILRRTSIDEIPQLINVLAGHMSIVGPRPPIVFEFSLYDDFAKRRLAVKPGITGLYQVTARNRAPFSQMLALDLEYIERRSVWLDVLIMARTAAAMFKGA